MFRFEFKEATPVLLILGAGAIVLALLGVNPLDLNKSLELWIRIALGVLGCALFVTAWLSGRGGVTKEPGYTLPPEYRKRFDEVQQNIRGLTPDRQILADRQIGRANFVVLNENILEARTDVVVSSDDNHLTAQGGVAKAILQRLGPDVEEELERLRLNRFRQGQLAITTGGRWNRRAVIHPAVIDLDENRYPTEDIIRTIVRRSLNCAVALGAQSIAFPVLGGGTGSKYMTPSNSVHALATEISAFLDEHKSSQDGLTHVELYIFNRDDAIGLPAEMFTVLAPKATVAQQSLAGDVPHAARP
ncbi:MAG: macro domain-containing protein [Gaiellaceae bacterium]